jgi:hypothetical protein
VSKGNHTFSAYMPQCRCVAFPFAVPGPYGNDEIIAHEWRNLPVTLGAQGVSQDRDHNLVGGYTYEAAMALCFWFMASSSFPRVECRIVPYDCRIEWNAEERPDAAIEIGCAIDAVRSEVWHRKEREEAQRAKRAETPTKELPA